MRHAAPNRILFSKYLATRDGVRELSPQAIAQVPRNRQAAFTLFMKAYEEVRAALQYLRHHEGDGDSIMPSALANARTEPEEM